MHDAIASIRAQVPDGVEVTGETPLFSDIADLLAKRLWLVIGFVVAVSMLLLMLVFRSVLVPLKAAVMNLLSIGAAYGVMVAVFQWGWGTGLLGLDHAVPISSWVPMLMFAILFGLSMDYEVFLLSRVREHWEATGDAHRSVSAAWPRPGRSSPARPRSWSPSSWASPPRSTSSSRCSASAWRSRSSSTRP